MRSRLSRGLLGKQAGTVSSITLECGILAGGENPDNQAPASTLGLFAFRTETLSVHSRTLGTAVKNAVGLSAPSKAYFIGGEVADQVYTGSASALTYATGSISTMASFLGSSKRYGDNNSGLNSKTSGYISGTNITSNGVITQNNIQILDFASESLDVNTITLLGAASNKQGSALSSNTAGYLVNRALSNAAVSKVEFFSLTASIIGTSLRAIFESASGVSSQRRGYWLGYKGSAATNTISSYDVECLRLSDDTVMDISTSTHVTDDKSWAGVMSAVRGYCLASSGSSAGKFNTGIDFITEASLNVSAGTLALAFSAGVSKYISSRDTKGYILGGIQGSSLSGQVTGFDYKLESLYSLSGSLKTAVSDLASVSGYSTEKGYTLGGKNIDETLNYDTTCVRFIDDSVYIVSTGLTPLCDHVGLQSEDVGYFTGGSGADIDSINNTSVYSLVLSTETSFPIAAELTASRSKAVAVSGIVAGFVIGGLDTSQSPNVTNTSIDSLSFITEQMSTSIMSLPTGTHTGQAVSSTFTYNKGYVYGGTSDGGNIRSDIYTFTLDGTDQTLSNLSTVLAGLRNGVGMCSINAGYFTGGISNTGLNSLIEKLTFYTETSQVTSAVLSPTNINACSITDLMEGEPTAAYVTSIRGLLAGGGISNNRFVKNIDGLDFTTESSLVTVNSIQHDYICGVNSRYTGYLLGDGNNTMSAIDFHTDGLTEFSQVLTADMERPDSMSFTSDIKGYFNSKYTPITGESVSLYGTVNYADSSVNALSVGLNTIKYKSVGMYSDTVGYSVGGHLMTLNSRVSVTDISALRFLSETTVLTGVSLSVPRSAMSSVNFSDKGYIYKGGRYKTGSIYVATSFSDMSEFNYTTATLTEVVAGFTYMQDSVINSASLNSLNKGYFLENGGNNVINFSKNTTTMGVLSATLLYRDTSLHGPASISFKTS